MNTASSVVLEPESATLPVPEPESRETVTTADAAEALRVIPVAFDLLRAQMLRLVEFAQDAAKDRDEELRDRAERRAGTVPSTMVFLKAVIDELLETARELVPETKAQAAPESEAANEAEPADEPEADAEETPDWVSETPDESCYTLMMLPPGLGRACQEIDMTREEYVALKDRLAEMRGIVRA